MNRRIIKIFLASSIVEFANERMAIENFIRNISDRFEELYDVKLQPLLCENFDDAYTVMRKQEEYNEKIRSSEFCFSFSLPRQASIQEKNLRLPDRSLRKQASQESTPISK